MNIIIQAHRASSSYLNILCNVFYDDPDKSHKPTRVSLTIKLLFTGSVAGVLTFSGHETGAVRTSGKTSPK